MNLSTFETKKSWSFHWPLLATQLNLTGVSKACDELNLSSYLEKVIF